MRVLSHPDVARGFTLCAVLANDREALRAQAGLAEECRGLLALSTQLAKLPQAARARAVSELVAGVSLRASARAALSPQPRAGFRPGPDLLRMLASTTQDLDAWGA